MRGHPVQNQVYGFLPAAPGKASPNVQKKKVNPCFPYAELFLIIGTDEFYTLENWYRTRDLGKMLKFLVANRNGEAEQKVLEERAVFLKTEYGLQCTFLEMERVEYSSSLIRKRIREKASIEGMLPESVIEFIRKNHCYE